MIYKNSRQFLKQYTNYVYFLNKISIKREFLERKKNDKSTKNYG